MIMTESNINRNKEWGRHLADVFYGTGIEKLPFDLNSGQADGFIERWKELNKENKTNCLKN
jgi:hypothetical protein